MPLKDKELAEDQKKTEESSKVDSLAKEGEHFHALENKHIEHFSPHDYKLKYEQEKRRKQRQGSKDYKETIVNNLTSHNATLSFQKAIAEARKEAESKQETALVK